MHSPVAGGDDLHDCSVFLRANTARAITICASDAGSVVILRTCNLLVDLVSEPYFIITYCFLHAR